MYYRSYHTMYIQTHTHIHTTYKHIHTVQHFQYASHTSDITACHTMTCTSHNIRTHQTTHEQHHAHTCQHPHLAEVFPLPLQNHFFVALHMTTAAGSWIPQYLAGSKGRPHSPLTQAANIPHSLHYVRLSLTSVDPSQHVYMRTTNTTQYKYFELKNSWGCRPNSNYLLTQSQVRYMTICLNLPIQKVLACT